ncbi:hypothetical protein ACMWP3_25695, partial [Escherichia coli]|uniref:hypothetical protein n=1 Tax=Escherichia coli TaxID=562 RepID=UPI0039E00B5F
TNDIADNVPGEAVFDRFVAFVSRVRQDIPAVEIDFISMSMAPCRTQWEKEYELANSKIHKYISSNPHLRYIDVTRVMRGA